MCGTKKPLQQELKGPSAPFLDFLPGTGKAPTHWSEWLLSAQGQDSWRSNDPAEKKANLWGVEGPLWVDSFNAGAEIV